MQKKILIVTVVALIFVLGAVLVWQKKMLQTENLPEPEEDVQSVGKDRVFVTDVDPDVSHWQIKETEFFTIKFPKEWYWLESDREKTGYHSRVITNNPEFPINKYADIAFFISGKYPLTLSNDTEVVASFRAAATSDAGTPWQSIDSVLRSIQEQFPPAECHYLSASGEIPTRASCLYVVNDHQKVQTYSIANKLHSISFTFRTTGNSLVQKDILDKIAENMVVKEAW